MEEKLMRHGADMFVLPENKPNAGTAREMTAPMMAERAAAPSSHHMGLAAENKPAMPPPRAAAAAPARHHTDNKHGMAVMPPESFAAAPMRGNAATMPMRESVAPMRENVVAMPMRENIAPMPMRENVAVVPMRENVAAMPMMENVAAMPMRENVAAMPMRENIAAMPMRENIAAMPMENNAAGRRHPQLAVAFVNPQRNAQERYDPAEALARGTLFPELDLPFMNIVNQPSKYAGTPLGELTAISFVAHELMLYLDTHGNDAEAFAMLQQMLRLKKEAHKRYTERFGPVTFSDMEFESDYTWTRDPWPWDAGERSGK